MKEIQDDRCGDAGDDEQDESQQDESELDETQPDETELDDLIRQVLTDVTSPPAAPMAAMWAHIEREHFGPAGVLPWRARRSPVRWASMLVPMAAALVVGVALGRYSAPQERTIVTPTARRQLATGTRSVPDTGAGPRTAKPAASNTAASNAPAPASTRATLPIRLAARSGDEAYQDEMGRYLVHTAALLTALPASGQSADSDAGVADQAATLLTQTHLLLDSQVGSDPALHRLLEDLELVLAQVARLHPTRGTTDLQLIHEALQQRDVLPRLHEAAVEAASTD